MSTHLTFLAPVAVGARRNGKRVRHFTTYPQACATGPATNTAAAKDGSVDPDKVSTTGNCPSPLQNTTIVHNIPSIAPHLSVPLAHPHDGDGYVLAVSFLSSGKSWVRGRFTRTKAFMKEAKAGRRLYRGMYGTPGSSGWDAPIKPKASSAEGAFIWGSGKKRRVFAFGPRALPLALDAATLVSKGPTALGSVLTDSPDLATERATELAAAPVIFGDSLFVVGLGRAQTGRLIGAFITEIGEDYSIRTRLPRIEIPSRCIVSDFAVGRRFCVLLLHRTASDSGTHMLGTLFGKKQEQVSASEIDTEFGSLVIVIPKDGSASGSCRLSGDIITKLFAVDDQEEASLRLAALVLSGTGTGSGARPIVRTSTLLDSQSGRLSAEELRDTNVRVRLQRLGVQLSAGPRGKSLNAELSEELEIGGDVSVLSTAKPASADRPFSEVYTIYDHSARKAGLIVIRAGGLALWKAEEDECEISCPLLSEDSRYVSVLLSFDNSQDLPAQLMVFDTESIEQGPVHIVQLDTETFGRLGSSAGGMWKNEAFDWSEEGSKPVKSAYEIFDSKRWNDIESGFSSLGLNQ